MKSNFKARARLIVWLAGLCGLGQATMASDWPQWRGPLMNGISAEKGWLDHWPADGPPVVWKAKVGLGFSSFAVNGRAAYTMGNDNNTDTVYCFEAASGKVLWKHSYPSDLGAKFFDGGTTGSPTLDGDSLYTLSRWGDLFCFEAATGKIVWSKNIQQETGLRVPTWGFGGAPRVHGNLLLLNMGEAGLALEKATGKVVWKSADKDCGYSTPLPVQINGTSVALIGSSEAYVAVDPATGAEKWRMRWLTEYGVNASDPVVDGDRVFISTGYGKGCALLKIGSGEPEVVWKSKAMRNQLNASVLFNGHLYGVDGDTTSKAALKCVEFATGAVKWTEPGLGSGALTVADGKLIVLSEIGELMVAPATPEGFKPTARAQVMGGKCWTVPVLANGRIYCRNGRGEVACVDARAEKSK